jgi:hypothetical protein
MRSSDRVIDLRLKVEAGLDDVAQILLTESAPHARQMHARPSGWSPVRCSR